MPGFQPVPLQALATNVQDYPEPLLSLGGQVWWPRVPACDTVPGGLESTVEL
jgi:hypothetical protein